VNRAHRSAAATEAFRAMGGLVVPLCEQVRVCVCMCMHGCAHVYAGLVVPLCEQVRLIAQKRHASFGRGAWCTCT